MEVKKIKNVNGKDDILIISDNKSVLFGKPYIFQFAIENRMPYFDEPEITYSGEYINMKLKAHDFDEDSLTYSCAFEEYDNELGNEPCSDKIERTSEGYEFSARANNQGEFKIKFQVCDDANPWACSNTIVTINDIP